MRYPVQQASEKSPLSGIGGRMNFRLICMSFTLNHHPNTFIYEMDLRFRAQFF
jgi:hypothetical protein